MSYVLTVIHPPVNGAAFGKAVVLDPVPYHATAAKRQARYVLETEGGATHEESGDFGMKLVLAEVGRLVTHEPSGLTFRIDPADSAPHPCPCGNEEDGENICRRLVLPTDHAYADAEDAYCLGCFTWSRDVEACLPENTAHAAEES
jgi:hypothetical protein